MNLHDELESLAQWAPPGANPDAPLRRARQIRTRRAIGVPAVAVLIVLVIVVPHWPRLRVPDPAAADRPVTLTFRVTSPGDARLLERTRSILEQRASALGLGNPRASIRDDHTLVLETTQPRDDTTLAALSAPGRFEARTVLKTFGMGFQVPTSLPGPSSPTAPASTLDAVIAKLGPAYQAALGVKRPDGSDYALLQAFRWLTPDEVALLPAEIQFNVPSISCAQLNGRGNAASLPPDARVTVCESDYGKFLLDPAALTGSDITGTDVHQSMDGSYRVGIQFTASSGPEWTATTRSAASGEACDPGEGPHCRIAFLVDGQVITAPAILGTLGGSVEVVAGSGTRSAERALAAQIGPRELPLPLELVSQG